jgi:hypothetical protein
MMIAAGGGTAGTSRVSSLSITAGGKLDLTNHDLAIDYTGTSPVAGLRTLIQTGFAGGAWNGAGLTSSSAAAAAATTDKTGLGYAEATEVLGAMPTTFSGVNVDGTTAVVRYTLFGDANLDLAVNINDFARLAAAFNTTALWFNGDFNYDNMANINDFALLAANFNKMLAGDLPRGTLVPEVESIGMIAALSAALRCRRRRTSA